MKTYPKPIHSWQALEWDNGYFPVSPSARGFKNLFTSLLGRVATVTTKAKLSKTGAGSGSYYSASELNGMIMSFWPAVCSSANHRGVGGGRRRAVL